MAFTNGTPIRDHPDAGLELAHFGQQDFTGDREGIGIYARPDGTGYLICTDRMTTIRVISCIAGKGNRAGPRS